MINRPKGDQNLKKGKVYFLGQQSSYDEFGPERVAVGRDDITIPDSEERERHSQDTENILKRTYVTRKGRTVRPPSRLRDFVM
ncbi:hypothetical protein AVEN_242037-1 [Araneus ventricosus]|uniref:Uncharacterized protein n=1 Tax=Araneus ventricosus TaxID=182803 RepID=A0A4Y2PXG0_ARAVE|nr:hypothetical protein AVEN_242037-1 [Araneus ventricosus]